MRVLVACEFSGVVRDAFIARGHHALSCDLLPTERPGPHYMGDVRDVLHAPWDLMIAHPPCTDIAVSGARYFADKWKDGRQAKSLAFFMELLRAPIERICVENPVCIVSSLVRPPDQIVQPWMFGHPESKTTCLWLKDLPTLKSTNMVALPDAGHWENQTPSGQNKLSPSPDRWKLRSVTYQGIADAMAQQWGEALRQVEHSRAIPQQELVL